MKRHLYRVVYRTDLTSRRHYLTVVARDADEAREYAKMRDPRFLATVRSPRRGAEVVTTGDTK